MTAPSRLTTRDLESRLAIIRNSISNRANCNARFVNASIDLGRVIFPLGETLSLPKVFPTTHLNTIH